MPRAHGPHDTARPGVCIPGRVDVCCRLLGGDEAALGQGSKQTEGKLAVEDAFAVEGQRPDLIRITAGALVNHLAGQRLADGLGELAALLARHVEAQGGFVGGRVGEDALVEVQP